MFLGPFRKFRVEVFSSRRVIADITDSIEVWILNFSRWRDKTIRVENVQNHETMIYLLQKRLNDADYKLGKARQHRERYTMKKKELESLTNRFAAGQLTDVEKSYMLQLQQIFGMEYKNYDPHSENLHDDVSVSCRYWISPSIKWYNKQVRGCEMRFDRINAELASSRERYWRAKQESQEKRDDMNRMIAFASVVLSVVLFEPFRLHFNRRAVRLENKKLMEDAQVEIRSLAASIQASNEAVLHQLQGPKPELVDSHCQTDSCSASTLEGQPEHGGVHNGASVLDMLKWNDTMYTYGLAVGVGVAVIVALQLGRQ
jgi:hypothetical protein